MNNDFLPESRNPRIEVSVKPGLAHYNDLGDDYFARRNPERTTRQLVPNSKPSAPRHPPNNNPSHATGGRCVNEIF